MSARIFSACSSAITKPACSFSSVNERRSPVSSRRRTTARRPLVRPLASISAPPGVASASWNAAPSRRSRSAAAASAPALSSVSHLSNVRKAVLSAGAPTRSGRPPKTSRLAHRLVPDDRPLVVGIEKGDRAVERGREAKRCGAPPRSAARRAASGPAAPPKAIAASAAPIVTDHQATSASTLLKAAPPENACALAVEASARGEAEAQRSAAPRHSLRPGFPLRASRFHPPRRIRAPTPESFELTRSAGGGKGRSD